MEFWKATNCCMAEYLFSQLKKTEKKVAE
uniref:Uncharacterized protein n=1 Tax=Rhizophora mucronata TaxID=61149 RepID=A0A2P2NT45_RHIMU